MDDIGLYKGKLNEALNIVPTMSQEKKWEAVTYWNDVAMRFQSIVAPVVTGNHMNGDRDTIIASGPTSKDVVNGEHVIANKTSSDLINSSCIGDHQQQATVASTLGVDNCTSNMIDHTDANLNAVALTTDVMCPAASAATNSAVIQDKPTSTAAAATTAISKHLDGIPMNSGIEYDNIVLSETLGCPGTTADVAGEIGNGQFDRGPTKDTGGAVLPQANTFVVTTASSASVAPVIHQHNHHHHHDQHVTIPRDSIISDDGNCLSQAIMIPSYHRHHTVDLYTHSERPLQQIQPYDVSGNHHQGHSEGIFHHHGNSQNRMRTFVYSNNHMANTNYAISHHPQPNISFGGSPDGTCGASFSNMFSPSNTPNVMENISSHDIEQIVDIKRELIVESELGDSAISNESAGSNNAVSNECANMVNTGQQQHTCNVCGKSGFSTKGNLKRHLKAHSGEKPFKCDYCDSCFTEKKSLKIHVRRHTGEKPYKCNVCEKLFSQTGVLQSHMALHLNERKFECQKCGKAFRQRSQLKLHLMRHDGVKRLECQTCNAKFLTKGDLERHCRIHTGEKPYRCELCSKTFTRQQSLNEHMNRHTGKKPYYCKYCDKAFSEMSACYKHAKTHKRQEQQQMVLQTV